MTTTPWAPADLPIAPNRWNAVGEDAPPNPSVPRESQAHEYLLVYNQGARADVGPAGPQAGDYAMLAVNSGLGEDPAAVGHAQGGLAVNHGATTYPQASLHVPAKGWGLVLSEGRDVIASPEQMQAVGYAYHHVDVPPDPLNIVGVSKVQNETTAVPLPVGTQPGDLLVLAMVAQGSVSCTDGRMGEVFFVPGSDEYQRGRGVWVGTATSSTADLSVATDSGDIVNRSFCMLLALRGVRVPDFNYANTLEDQVNVGSMAVPVLHDRYRVLVVGLLQSGVVTAAFLDAPQYTFIDDGADEKVHADMWYWTAPGSGRQSNPASLVTLSGTVNRADLVTLALESA